jgi:hypothetical protein
MPAATHDDHERSAAMKRIARFVLLLAMLVWGIAAADVGDRKYIREGMSEGDVLVKIGKPDSESIDTGGGATVTVKRWIYLPAPGDDQIITTIVIRNGKAKEVTRQVSR